MERRLAAILAADIVGYSRLMERDEAGTLAALKSRHTEVIQPTVSKHRGRIVKLMGDGVLVEFASAVNAVGCAVDLQAAMDGANAGIAESQRIVLRIGINLGDVIVEGSDIYGDGVNIAARLEGLSEPGGLCISGSVFEQINGKLPHSFVSLGMQTLKNINRPIHLFRLVGKNGTEAAAPAALELPRRDKPSIAVLPFVNISGDPEQAYFADGLAEDLITDLSKVPGLLVIARNSSFAYKGRSIDVRSIGTDLGVRYVIEGSVRRSLARVRINVQLIEATTGSHLWAERYDRELEDIFTVRDEVIGKVVNALAGALPSAQPQSRRRTTNLEAYDLFVRGRWLAFQSLEATRAARELLRKAIELDSGLAEAHAWLAVSHYFGWLYFGGSDDDRKLARAAASKALVLDPENPDAHIVQGYVRAYEGELAEGVAKIEQALRVNPNHAIGWGMLADIRVFEGRAEEAIECARNGFRLDPYAPPDTYWQLGWALYAAGRYEETVATLHGASAQVPGVRRILAAALAQLGRDSEAREEARKYLLEFPHFSAEQWGRTQPFRNDADRQHFIEGYIKAGLPA